MHDHDSLKDKTDQQLHDMMMTIERKLPGCYNQGAYDLLCQAKEAVFLELQERQMMENLKVPPLPTMSLTDDELSRKEKEDEAKNRQPKDNE